MLFEVIQWFDSLSLALGQTRNIMKIGDVVKCIATYSALICAGLYVIGLCWNLGFNEHWKIYVPSRDLDFIATIIPEVGPRNLLINIIVWLGIFLYYHEIHKRIIGIPTLEQQEAQKQLTEIKNELDDSRGQKWTFRVFVAIGLIITVAMVIFAPIHLIPVVIGTACGYAFEKVITWKNPFLRMQISIFAIGFILAYSYFDGYTKAPSLAYKTITVTIDGIGEIKGRLIKDTNAGIYIQNLDSSTGEITFLPSSRIARITFSSKTH